VAKKKQAFGCRYTNKTYAWRPNQPNRNKVHFFYSWHFDYTLEMSFSNKKSRQIGFCPQKLAIQTIV
jgi:hypothetical protein